MKPIKIAHRLYSTFWKIFKPQTVGVRAILIKDEKILLVKHTYLNSWFLAGGGVKRNETFQQGIQRELSEELGISGGDFVLHGVYNNFFEGKSDSIVVFQVKNFSINPKKNSEIESLDFFDLNQLPENTSQGTRKRIEEFRNGNFPVFGLW